MKVLVIGSGGREHALVWKLKQSPKVEEIYCAPGNGGIGECATCLPISAMEFEKLADFAEEKKIDLTVVGMDDPLVGGIVDIFNERKLPIFGPNKKAAILEGSKAFSKELMKKYEIPTAGYEIFTSPQKAKEYLEKASYPIVLKADGLALGKGVLICNTKEEAEQGVQDLMMDKHFGEAGDTIVIEEFMIGREVSVLAFVDGKHIKTMASAQDHKRAFDLDQGLNTGGMGTFSPSPYYTSEIDAFCKKEIYQKTVDAMAAEGRPFQGILFFGLMITSEGVKVLEYNVRFGDPEAQVVLIRMENDLIDVIEKCLEGNLDQVDLKFKKEAAVCVIAASGGYPVSYEKGYEIFGLSDLIGQESLIVYHSGTKKEGDVFKTSGGRVLGVTVLGKDLEEAREKAYEGIKQISFEGMFYRRDIGIAVK